MTYVVKYWACNLLRTESVRDRIIHSFQRQETGVSSEGAPSASFHHWAPPGHWRGVLLSRGELQNSCEVHLTAPNTSHRSESLGNDHKRRPPFSEMCHSENALIAGLTIGPLNKKYVNPSRGELHKLARKPHPAQHNRSLVDRNWAAGL